MVLTVPVYESSHLFNSSYDDRLESIETYYNFIIHDLELASITAMNSTLHKALQDCTSSSTLSPYISRNFLDTSLNRLSRSRDRLRSIVDRQERVMRSLEFHQHRLQDAQKTLEQLSHLSTSPFPELPLDVGRKIIEFAAEDRPTALVLSLTSKEIQSWSDKTLYKHIVVHQWKPTAFEQLLSNPSPRIILALEHTISFWNRYSRNGSAFYAILFKHTPNLRFLSIASRDSYQHVPPALIPSSLERLYCEPTTFVEPGSLHFEPFGHEIYRKITHFVWDTAFFSSSESWNALRRLPSLTHLFLNNVSPTLRWYTDVVNVICPHIPSQLKILIIVVPLHWRGADKTYGGLADGRVDRRILVGMKGRKDSDKDDWVVNVENPVPFWDGSDGFETMWADAAKMLNERDAALGLC